MKEPKTNSTLFNRFTVWYMDKSFLKIYLRRKNRRKQNKLKENL